MPDKVYRTAIYCRLSREDGDKVESNSIASQRAICEDYIARHDDLELVCEPFVDDGYSGVSFNRPQFKKLEEAIRKGALDCIVVKDLSRFSRNYIDGGRYIEKIFPQLGIRFIAINDAYDSLTGDPQSDSFVILYQDTDGGQISVDGKNWVAEADYEKNNAASDVQWWTADEYEAWMNEQKKEMESLIGTGDGWYDGQGVFHEFTQESVDAMMDSYKETLESIKKGVLYSKDDGDGDTYSMIPPTEDVVSSYSVDVTKDNGKTVHIGDYSTVEELDKAISDAVKNGQLTQEEADSIQK